MAIELKPLRRTSINDSDYFRQEFLIKQTPVILTSLMDHWKAKEKWTLNYFKISYGHLKVPVYSQTISMTGKKYMQPDKKMYFQDYIQAIQSGPTDLRLFLFNIFDYAPELKEDYEVPTIMDGFIKEYPFTFFGGENSKVALHFDIDMSNVFLSQFEGRKRVVLFAPEQSTNLYHLPFTVASHIDINNPDYEKYPALANTVGYECILHPGETLFIPSGFWHYIEYIDAGFSMSQRAANSIFDKIEGAYNLTKHYVIDRSLNKLLGEHWKNIKEQMAYNRVKI